jgi:phenylacetate-CoA ligase
MEWEKIYHRFPLILQHLACSLEGWRLQKQRFGGAFPALLREAESRTFWSRDQIANFRDQRLRRFIRHCAATVPYYRRQFRELDLVPEDIRTLKDLQALPILTKKDVQEHYPELVSEAVPAPQRIIIHTSGTTGSGLQFATTSQAIQEQRSIWWRYRRWHGLNTDIWCGRILSARSLVPLSQTRPPFWRYNFPGKEILFSAYHMSPANLGAYVDKLRRSRPAWLHGFPSLLVLLAAYILETGADLGYQVRWVTTGGENLLPQQVSLIEQAFGVRPVQHYGMEEAVANISECDHGALHVDEDLAAVEFIPNPDGPGYKIIGTNFSNPATPLVRYDVQDLVTLADDHPCPCGRPGRLVATLDGRLDDYIILKNGARLAGVESFFKDIINIREAQIYQKTPGEIVIRVVRGKNFSEADESAFLQKSHDVLGNDMDVLIEYVDKLARSRTGKLRFIISDISAGKLDKAGSEK